MLRYLKVFNLTIAVLFVFVTVYGQQRQLYKGTKTLGNYKGTTEFGYVIEDKDTIYDGPFLMKESNLELNTSHKTPSFLFKGHFNHGKADGKWQFQFGKYKTGTKRQVVDLEYRLLLEGTQEIGEGNITHGKLNGLWTINVNDIKDSKITQQLFHSAIQFKDGKPQQDFTIETDKVTLVGRFLRSGLAHDEWSSFRKGTAERLENWTFKEGILYGINISDVNGNEEFAIFDTINKVKTIKLDTTYFNLVKAKLYNQYGTVPKLDVLGTLKRNHDHYETIKSIFSSMGQNGVDAGLLVKVPIYPMDSIERENVKKTVVEFKKAKSLSDKILTNSHLNILRRSDKDVAFYYKTAESITESFLTSLQQWAVFEKQGILEHLDRKKLVNRLWSNKIPNTQIQVVTNDTTNDRIFKLDGDRDFDFTSGKSQDVLQMASFANLALGQVIQKLGTQFTDELRLSKLNDLEKELVVLNDSLSRITLQDTTRSVTALENGLAHIKALGENKLGDYAKMVNTDTKFEFGDNLKVCLRSLIALSHVLVALPNKQQEIEKRYEDQFWNLFLATTLSEQVKKHIVNAYNGRLVPFFYANALTVDCEKVNALTDKINNIHNRIWELREEETDKLERKLKREKDPEKIMELLLQKPNNQNK